MKSSFATCFAVAVSLMIGAPAIAHTPPVPQPVASGIHSGSGMPVFVQNIAPAAVDAVKVVDAFSNAIKAAKIYEAAKLLDPQVLILESGSSERSRDEYLREHAIADAAFMQTAHQQLRYRQARAAGDLAWVGTESTIQTVQDKTNRVILSTETMVLRKTGQGWKIVHIHWSSRPAPKS